MVTLGISPPDAPRCPRDPPPPPPPPTRRTPSGRAQRAHPDRTRPPNAPSGRARSLDPSPVLRSEEHTSELQSQSNLVCRLLLEKKKQIDTPHDVIIKLSM